MRLRSFVPAAVCLLALPFTPAFAQHIAPIARPDGTSLAKGLEIGTRILHTTLDEPSRRGRVPPGADPNRPAQREGTFLGSLTDLDVDQEYAPVRLYLQYFFHPNFGAGISYDEIRAETTDALGSDGFVEMSGPLLYVVGRFQTDRGLTPFAELGIGLYNAGYDEDPVWANKGRSNERAMAVEDPTAFYIGLGCDVAINDRWSLNLYTRAVFNATVDTDAVYPRRNNRVFQRGEFPLDYYGLGAGVKYAFD